MRHLSRKLLRIFAPVLIVLFTNTPSTAREVNGFLFYHEIPVLSYHHFIAPREPNPFYWNLTVTTAQFEAQLRLLNRRGYTSMTVAELVDIVAHGQPLPPRPVIITVDDGYVSLYTRMFPLLVKYRVKATVYMIASRIGKEWRGMRYLSESQIREMAASGLVDFQSHGFDIHWKDLDRWASNKWIPESSLGTPAAEILPWTELVDDLARSKQVLEALTGRPVVAFAVPFGQTTPRLEAAARQVGFASVALVRESPSTEPIYTTLNRRYVERYHSLGYFAEELLKPFPRKRELAGTRIPFFWF